MTIAEVQRVCFVGAGTMGCYNSIVAAVAGYEVALYDIDATILEQAPARHAEFAAFLVANGYCSEDDIAPALDRIASCNMLEQALAGADLVSESVIEKLDIKRSVHSQIESLCSPETIITTNSSALPVSAIEDALERGERFAALHSHLGAPLVDIVGGARTNAATIDVLTRYVLSLGGVPLILKKEHPGYVLNALLGPLLSTGMLLVSREQADFADVDRAWMYYRSAPMGPFAMMDLFGLELVRDSWLYREETPDNADLRARILSLLEPLIAEGNLGMKSGQGFYCYPEPAYQKQDFLSGDLDLNQLYAPLAAALVGNAIYLAALGVAEPADIDMAWKTGTYLDVGPFEILQAIGVEEYLSMFRAQLDAGLFETAKVSAIEHYLAAGEAM